MEREKLKKESMIGKNKKERKNERKKKKGKRLGKRRRDKSSKINV